MNFDTKLSEHGENLLKMYQLMANDGYNQKDGTRVESAYSEFEMHKFRQICQPHFHFHDVKTVLDYGSGGSDWDAPEFDPKSQDSAKNSLMLNSDLFMNQPETC